MLVCSIVSQFVLYSLQIMENDPLPHRRAAWPAWAEFLHRRGLDGLVAWALEAASPLNVLAAQALYFGGSFLRPAFSSEQMEALAGLLEDRDETQAFIAFLHRGLPI
jgi:hypothetical protein